MSCQRRHGTAVTRKTLDAAPVQSALCGEEGVNQLSGYFKIQVSVASDGGGTFRAK